MAQSTGCNGCTRRRLVSTAPSPPGAYRASQTPQLPTKSAEWHHWRAAGVSLDVMSPSWTAP
eukprot:scaffold410251_cov33-Prasinocladus_malaysianus.AAC.1